jgi:hypothetical protein
METQMTKRQIALKIAHRLGVDISPSVTDQDFVRFANYLSVIAYMRGRTGRVTATVNVLSGLRGASKAEPLELLEA